MWVVYVDRSNARRGVRCWFVFAFSSHSFFLTTFHPHLLLLSCSPLALAMSYLPSFTTLARLFSLVSVLSVSTLAGLLYTYQTKLIYPSGLPDGAPLKVWE